jgi:aspartate/methionine/tyrosine aminotransferase
MVNKLWSYHDYTTIGPNAVSDYIARKALQPETRAKILGRTREILRSNRPLLKHWVAKHREYLSFIPPKAGAIAYMKYSLKINSTRLAERLLREKSTLVVPGDHFGMDHYLRIGYGHEQERLVAGLERVGDMLSTLHNLPKAVS